MPNSYRPVREQVEGRDLLGQHNGRPEVVGDHLRTQPDARSRLARRQQRQQRRPLPPEVVSDMQDIKAKVFGLLRPLLPGLNRLRQVAGNTKADFAVGHRTLLRAKQRRRSCRPAGLQRRKIRRDKGIREGCLRLRGLPTLSLHNCWCDSFVMVMPTSYMNLYDYMSSCIHKNAAFISHDAGLIHGERGRFSTSGGDE